MKGQDKMVVLSEGQFYIFASRSYYMQTLREVENKLWMHVTRAADGRNCFERNPLNAHFNVD
jgi:hypothetical protein